MRFITAVFLIMFSFTALAGDENTTLEKYKKMLEIYRESCYASGQHDNFVTMKMPMFSNDRLVNRFKGTGVKNFDLHIVVFAGFELGRALNLTDLEQKQKDEICENYAKNFASTLVGAQAITNGGSTKSSPPLPSPGAVLLDISNWSMFEGVPNPLNDFLVNKNVKRVELTPRVAEQSSCLYMYSVLAKHPVVPVSTVDASLDMIQDMLFDFYPQQKIKESFTYLVLGAKQGRLLFITKQDPNLCYD